MRCGLWLEKATMGEVSLVKPLESWGQLWELPPNTGSLIWPLSPHKAVAPWGNSWIPSNQVAGSPFLTSQADVPRNLQSCLAA